MSVCRSQEVTIAAVFPNSFHFCDISTDLSSVFFSFLRWVWSTASAQWSNGEFNGAPYQRVLSSLRQSVSSIIGFLVKVKISRTGQGHFLIVNPPASIFVCRQYWLGLEKWTHSIFAGEMSWPSHVSERSSLIMVQLLKLCKVRWVLGDGGGGWGFFCPPIVTKPPSNIAELFSEAFG